MYLTLSVKAMFIKYLLSLRGLISATLLSALVLIAGLVLLKHTQQFYFSYLVFLGGYGLTASFFVLALNFPSYLRISRRTLLALIPLGLLVITTPFDLVIEGMRITDATIEPIYGPLQWIFIATVTAYVLVGAGALVMRYKQLLYSADYVLKYVLLGISWVMLSVLVFNVWLPGLGMAEANLFTAFISGMVVFCVLYVVQLEVKARARAQEILAMQQQERRMFAELLHGLQTPLAVVKAQFGEHTDAPSTALHKAVDELSQTIYAIVEYVRSARVTLKLEPVDLSNVLKEIVEYVEVVAQANGLAIQSDIPSSVVVTGDRQSLETIFTNLLSNAIRHAVSGARIDVRVTVENERAIVFVANQSISLDAESLAHIFEPFTRTQTSDGMGLGLAIVKRLVLQLQGDISVTSSNGLTEFRVVLPVASSKPV